jgi:hypothetical protein
MPAGRSGSERERTDVPHRLRSYAAPIALALVLATASACSGGPEDEPEPVRPDYRTTIARSELGDRLTVTAGVERCLSRTSFVVRDADLPANGLLIVVHTPVAVWYPVLVTVTGTVMLFRYGDFTEIRLGGRASYAAFDGNKAILAEKIRVWSDHTDPATDPATDSDPSTPATDGCGRQSDPSVP